MKHCVYCGEILNDDASFCTKCGKSVAILKENIKVEENKKQKSGIGFGVASICCFVIPILSFVFGGLSIYYGVKNKGTAQIVCGVIGIVLGVLSCIVWSLVWSWFLTVFIAALLQHLKDIGVIVKISSFLIIK